MNFMEVGSIGKGLITALYCRTAQKCNMGIEAQETMLQHFAEDNNFSNVVIYSDNGYSGVNFSRPAIHRLQANVEAGLVGHLLVKDISRISRNFQDAHKFLDGIRRKGVAVRFVIGGFDYYEIVPTMDKLKQAIYQFHIQSKRRVKAL